eukprot:SRR837773.6504.p2 GENE.SRR837773.6504~~SRR837773.6504.p2  ORF type:complete len:178 (-),score=62.89 SRR837773.6504:2-463(-)
MIVGVSVKDVEGSAMAMRKAVQFAQPGDKIAAIHVPRLVPEMMLSSMSDPADASEDALAALSNMPSKAGAAVMEKMKAVAQEELSKLGKSNEVDYKVSAPTSVVKSGLLAACKYEGASLLVIGAGVGGKGSIPSYVVQNAGGLTVCVVRDHIE